MDRPFVLISEELDPAARAWLEESCEVVACHFTQTEEFERLLARADGLIVRTYTRVNAELLDKARKLKVVGRAGVGLDRIEIEECRRRGVSVVHTPDANSVAVAEYVFAMLTDAVRPRVFLDKAVPASEWNALRKELEAPNQLCELRLGILGLGRIGSRVARIARGFEMDVAYYDVAEIGEEKRFGAQPMPLTDLLHWADIVTVHVDTRASNHRFVNAHVFRQMRPTVIFVNTSRGFIVDEFALAAFLRDNNKAVALIDVHEPEPFGPTYPLLQLPNAHVSPHLAAATATAHANMSWVVKDVWAVLQGQPPRHRAW
ncbi:MAG TPA: NAD(P)-dependent oxidoreductase [Phycisphaerales bacterium]|nr:NAD(P)-dependent oxidoreductase [Phycisphaerales bacterium]